jgi:hypothetical protein
MKTYTSQFLDPALAESWFALVNEAYDAEDIETLKGLSFRKGHPDIAAAPNVGVIFWGYLRAAIETLKDGTKKQADQAGCEWQSLEAWPLSPLPHGHAPGYWTRAIVPTPKNMQEAKKKSHKEKVKESLESVRERAKHLA